MTLMSAHILVVDDEPAVRDVLVTWLQAAGYRCSEAADATVALAVIEAGSVDVALLDLALPGPDGLWLAQQIREQTSNVALIMVTGLQRFDAAVAGIRLGVLDYLLKPFSRQELMQAVRRAVEWRRTLEDDRGRAEQLQREIVERRESIESGLASLEMATAGAIGALLQTLHTRNPEASAHAARVARMAVDLAVALRVEPAELGDIERGALLHDIGKVALPDALFHKVGPFAEEDVALIRSHVELGRDILRKVPALSRVADIVGASHEAYDGSGYPAGLSGTDIPRGARIISIVDTFDALTWGRNVRDPLTFARAAAELVRCAGSQFDPDIVNVWLRVADPAHDEDDVDAAPSERVAKAVAPW